MPSNPDGREGAQYNAVDEVDLTKSVAEKFTLDIVQGSDTPRKHVHKSKLILKNEEDEDDDDDKKLAPAKTKSMLKLADDDEQPLGTRSATGHHHRPREENDGTQSARELDTPRGRLRQALSTPSDQGSPQQHNLRGHGSEGGGGETPRSVSRRHSRSHSRSRRRSVSRSMSRGGDDESGESDHGDDRSSVKRSRSKVVRDGPSLEWNILEQWSVEQLKNMKQRDLEILFNHYAHHGHISYNGNLSALAQHCIQRVILMVRELLLNKHPNVSEKDIQKFLKKELPYVLPDGGDWPSTEKTKIKEAMEKSLMGHLNIKRNGQITLNEVTMMWSSFAADTFTMREEAFQALSCSVM